MNRKSLLFSILILILGISLLAGCSGGSSKDDDNTLIEKGPSSDYYGLEVGAKLVWKVNEVPSNQTWLSTYEVIDEDPPGEFKTKWSTSNDDDEIDGEFIIKSPDGFYTEIADWDIDEVTGEEERDDYMEEDFLVIVKNPIKLGFKSDYWGEAIRQENVTVPAGTFKAWVFHNVFREDDDEMDYLYTYYFWFVPYLGLVKSTSEITKEGDSEATKSITAVLQSYSF